MKSKTIYLEGVSQNSDTLLVDHGGVFMSPVIALQWVSVSKTGVWMFGKTTSSSGRVVFAWAQTVIPLEVQTRDDRMHRTLSRCLWHFDR